MDNMTRPDSQQQTPCRHPTVICLKPHLPHVEDVLLNGPVIFRLTERYPKPYRICHVTGFSSWVHVILRQFSDKVPLRFLHPALS